ncbi:hypothetical protein DPMN_137913 [Dreissena polymorpha]|uniref:Uncharacterized protein n=1 Tax=Dreissena polymorpha TaxID=45954 RepID=A0A9D4JF46_DREPO|nr:hypothetical protein DPMN_137913 [Dreissena polymorpha]
MTFGMSAERVLVRYISALSSSAAPYTHVNGMRMFSEEPHSINFTGPDHLICRIDLLEDGLEPLIPGVVVSTVYRPDHSAIRDHTMIVETFAPVVSGSSPVEGYFTLRGITWFYFDMEHGKWRRHCLGNKVRKRL